MVHERPTFERGEALGAKKCINVSNFKKAIQIFSPRTVCVTYKVTPPSASLGIVSEVCNDPRSKNFGLFS